MENEINENCKTTYIRELSTVKPSAWSYVKRECETFSVNNVLEGLLW